MMARSCGPRCQPSRPEKSGTVPSVYACPSCSAQLVAGAPRTCADSDGISADATVVDFECPRCATRHTRWRIPRVRRVDGQVRGEWTERWSGGPPIVALTLLRPWVAVSNADSLAAELARELGPRHVLFGRAVQALARRSDCDDVLFVSLAQAFVVHLTWTGRQEVDPRWPSTETYASLEAFIEERMVSDAADVDDDDP